MTDPTPLSAFATQGQALQDAILRIIQLGRDRCGVGFGKYPLGVRDALRELEPFIENARVQERLNEFDKRLEG